MNPFHELLQDVKKRPNMYLGKASISLLYAFISGGNCFHYKYTGDYFDFMPGFQEFIQKRYNIKLTHNWSRIILFHSLDEEEAFYKFFELYEEFLQAP